MRISDPPAASQRRVCIHQEDRRPQTRYPWLPTPLYDHDVCRSFERAAEYDVSAEAVNAALVERRSASGDDSGTTTEVASDVSDTDDLPRRPRSESGPCRRRRRCARSRPPRRRAGSRGARRATLARVDDFGRQRPAPRRRRGRGRLARGRRAGGRLARSSRGVARASGATRGRPPGAGVGVPRRSDAGREPRSVAYGSAGRGRTPKSDAGERSGAARVRDRVLASEAVSGGRRGVPVPTADRDPRSMEPVDIGTDRHPGEDQHR